MANVPVAADSTHFGPHLCKAGIYTVGEKGDERKYTDFNGALAFLKSQSKACWRRPNQMGNWGVVVAVDWRNRAT
jgi:hypothetical protein